ncbi:MAG TPA: hypothetical protein VNZ44_20300, partial [Pyrinomonadaceae bacterium]|nr:hypothetical protein [Pyrinomonadaceae bacterium]
MFSLKRFTSIALLLCLAAVAARAQGATGSITGTVSDQAGARVAGASVKVTGLDAAVEREVVTGGE